MDDKQQLTSIVVKHSQLNREKLRTHKNRTGSSDPPSRALTDWIKSKDEILFLYDLGGGHAFRPQVSGYDPVVPDSPKDPLGIVLQ